MKEERLGMRKIGERSMEAKSGKALKVTNVGFFPKTDWRYNVEFTFHSIAE